MKQILLSVILFFASEVIAGIDVKLCVGTQETVVGCETVTEVSGDTTYQTSNLIFDFPLVYSNCDLLVAMNDFTRFCSDVHITNRTDVMAYNAGSIFAGLSKIIRPAPYGVYVDMASGWEVSGVVITGYKTTVTTEGGKTTQTVIPEYRNKYAPTTSPVDYSVAITNFSDFE